MKIVNLETFLKYPSGTLFTKYTPQVFGETCIKCENCGEIDFFLRDILPLLPIDISSSEEQVEVLDQAEKSGKSFDVDFETISRDGMFERDQLFVIWERRDIEKLIYALQSCL